MKQRVEKSHRIKSEANCGTHTEMSVPSMS